MIYLSLYYPTHLHRPYMLLAMQALHPMGRRLPELWDRQEASGWQTEEEDVK